MYITSLKDRKCLLVGRLFQNPHVDVAPPPVLMALGGLSSLFGGGGEGGGGEKTDSTAQLIEEIKGLRADLNAGKISVNMDGQKVTSKVSAIVDKGSSNSYAKR